MKHFRSLKLFLCLITEQIQLEVCLVNPIKVTLVLSNVFLLWDFVPVEYGEELNKENPTTHVSNETHFSKVCVDSLLNVM